MPNNRGKKKKTTFNGSIVDVLEITWHTTDPEGNWYAFVGDTNEPALLKDLVSRGRHSVNPGFTVDLWTYELISRTMWNSIKHGKTPVPKRSSEKPAKTKSGHYPGKGKVSVLLVGGPKDGERIWLPKGRTFVTLNQSTRESFSADSEIPFIVKVDYEKRDDGNFHFVE